MVTNPKKSLKTESSVIERPYIDSISLCPHSITYSTVQNCLQEKKIKNIFSTEELEIIVRKLNWNLVMSLLSQILNTYVSLYLLLVSKAFNQIKAEPAQLLIRGFFLHICRIFRINALYNTKSLEGMTLAITSSSLCKTLIKWFYKMSMNF